MRELSPSIAMGLLGLRTGDPLPTPDRTNRNVSVFRFRLKNGQTLLILQPPERSEGREYFLTGSNIRNSVSKVRAYSDCVLSDVRNVTPSKSYPTEISLATAHQSNPGKSTFVVNIVQGGVPVVVSGYNAYSSIIRTELWALYGALIRLRDHHTLRIYTYSGYLSRTLNPKYLQEKRENRWRKSQGKELQNSDVLIALCQELDNHEWQTSEVPKLSPHTASALSAAQELLDVKLQEPDPDDPQEFFAR